MFNQNISLSVKATLFLALSTLFACSTDPIEHNNIPSSQERIAATEEKGTADAGVKKPDINPTAAPEKSPIPETGVSAEAPVETPNETEPAVETPEETPAEPELSSLEFTWDSDEGAGLSSFRLFSKIDPQGELVMLEELQVAGLNLAAPTHSFVPSAEQLAAWKGQNVCFSIRAVNATGESEPSMESCLEFL